MAGKWARMLTVEGGEPDSFAHIQSTEEAAYFLLDQWKRERSASYCRAVRMCAKAIRGEVSDEGAYIAFMALVNETKLALVSNTRYEERDVFLDEIERILSESILLDLRDMWQDKCPPN